MLNKEKIKYNISSQKSLIGNSLIKFFHEYYTYSVNISFLNCVYLLILLI